MWPPWDQEEKHGPLGGGVAAVGTGRGCCRLGQVHYAGTAFTSPLPPCYITRFKRVPLPQPVPTCRLVWVWCAFDVTSAGTSFALRQWQMPCVESILHLDTEGRGKPSIGSFTFGAVVVSTCEGCRWEGIARGQGGGPVAPQPAWCTRNPGACGRGCTAALAEGSGPAPRVWEPRS